MNGFTLQIQKGFNMPKILIVEDDTDINALLVKIVHAAGYDTVSAFSGTEAELLMAREIPSLILLDLKLPGLSGERLLRKIRKELQSNTPVIIISAKNSLDNKVFLLKDGADDYITKPFEPEEVIARIQVCLRRVKNECMNKGVIHYKKLELHPDSRIILLNGHELSLTGHEFDILLLLMQNPEKVYSRESLYELVWNGGYYGENNTVNVHISNIRKKMKHIDPVEEYIQTVYGIGFKLS